MQAELYTWKDAHNRVNVSHVLVANKEMKMYTRPNNHIRLLKKLKLEKWTHKKTDSILQIQIPWIIHGTVQHFVTQVSFTLPKIFFLNLR